MAPSVQLAWIWAPPPGPRTRGRVEVVEPKHITRRPPPTWGDCQDAEAKRVRLVVLSGKAARAEDVEPEPCERDRCRQNVRVDFPNATGETCALRIVETRGEMTPIEIARKVNCSERTVLNIIERAAVKWQSSHPKMIEHIETCAPRHRVRVQMLELFARPMTTAELAAALGVETLEEDGGRLKHVLSDMRKLEEIADGGDGRMQLTPRGWERLARELEG